MSNIEHHENEKKKGTKILTFSFYVINTAYGKILIMCVS